MLEISDDNEMAVNESEIVIVALKPYNILEVLKELNSLFIPSKHILVSLATGISLEQIQNKVTASVPIFRGHAKYCCRCRYVQ